MITSPVDSGSNECTVLSNFFRLAYKTYISAGSVFPDFLLEVPRRPFALSVFLETYLSQTYSKTSCEEFL